MANGHLSGSPDPDRTADNPRGPADCRDCGHTTQKIRTSFVVARWQMAPDLSSWLGLAFGLPTSCRVSALSLSVSVTLQINTALAFTVRAALRPLYALRLSYARSWGFHSHCQSDGYDGDDIGSRFRAVWHGPKSEAPFSAPQAKKKLGPKCRFTVNLSGF